MFLHGFLFTDGMAPYSTCLEVLEYVKKNTQGGYEPMCTSDGMYENKQVSDKL